jgi:hypothetical protein
MYAMHSIVQKVVNELSCNLDVNARSIFESPIDTSNHARYTTSILTSEECGRTTTTNRSEATFAVMEPVKSSGTEPTIKSTIGSICAKEPIMYESY